jgi:hypothetical protein
MPLEKVTVKQSQKLPERDRQHPRDTIDYRESTSTPQTPDLSLHNFLFPVLLARIDGEIEFFAPTVRAAKKIQYTLSHDHTLASEID